MGQTGAYVIKPFPSPLMLQTNWLELVFACSKTQMACILYDRYYKIPDAVNDSAIKLQKIL